MHQQIYFSPSDLYHYVYIFKEVVHPKMKRVASKVGVIKVVGA